MIKFLGRWYTLKIEYATVVTNLKTQLEKIKAELKIYVHNSIQNIKPVKSIQKQPPVRINFNPVSLSRQKIIKVYDAYIELRHDCFVWNIEFIASEPVLEDETIGEWEKVTNSYCQISKRENFSAIDIDYVQKTQGNKQEESYWKIVVSFFGVSQDVKIYINDEHEAKNLYNKTLSWGFDK